MNIYTYEYLDAQGQRQAGLNPVLATNSCRAMRKAATELDNSGIEAGQIEVKQVQEDWM